MTCIVIGSLIVILSYLLVRSSKRAAILEAQLRDAKLAGLPTRRSMRQNGLDETVWREQALERSRFDIPTNF